MLTTIEENKALILRAYEEIWNQGNLDVIEEIVSPDCEAYSPQNPSEPVGFESAREGVTAARNAFPDLTRTAEEMVAEGGRVMVRSRVTGTHRGEFLGMPPTGRGRILRHDRLRYRGRQDSLRVDHDRLPRANATAQDFVGRVMTRPQAGLCQ